MGIYDIKDKKKIVLKLIHFQYLKKFNIQLCENFVNKIKYMTITFFLEK